MELLKTDLTTISSLNGHRSSMLPPPLAIIITSGGLNSFLMDSELKPSIASDTNGAASSPWTGTGHKRILQGYLSLTLFKIS